ncbi:MAG TPA: isopentenyl-diphosphate Delta-isomerase [Puia sp.]|jgi:isopentenyl-diphosphate delta-isomerase|nr:isopentenyl-diphosphate Delta-isomerase [Puia sp.]
MKEEVPDKKEEVILVDESDRPVGVMEKMEAHRQAVLHRAFSVFIFNSRGEMLLQQRAEDKYHSAGLWTNACCSHPRPGEDIWEAASRRLQEELGFSTPLERLFSFTYRSEFENGLTEFEFDHVFIGIYDQEIFPNRDEVSDYRYMPLPDIETELRSSPQKYTTWFRLAFPLLQEKLPHSQRFS